MFERLQELAKSFKEYASSDHYDPAVGQDLQAHPDEAARDRLAARELGYYKDTLVPRVGSKAGWQNRVDKGLTKGRPHIIFDLNDFKHLNDTFDYQTGDAAIQQAGNIFADAAEKHGHKVRLARMGGDEFVGYAEHPDHLHEFLRSVHDGFDAAVPVGGYHKLSFSAGLGSDLASATASLHEAKAAKRAKHGDFRNDMNATVGHGEHFIYNGLPGAKGLVPAAPNTDVPKGLQKPANRPPMPGPGQRFDFLRAAP